MNFCSKFDVNINIRISKENKIFFLDKILRFKLNRRLEFILIRISNKLLNLFLNI